MKNSTKIVVGAVLATIAAFIGALLVKSLMDMDEFCCGKYGDPYVEED